MCPFIVERCVVNRVLRHQGAAFAAVSHLPHLLAYAMVGSIIGQPAAEDFLALAGPGFRDFTRIAASDPKMWSDILRANSAKVLAQSRLFRQALQEFENAMQAESEQPLQELITRASRIRSHWHMNAGHKPHR